VPDQLTVPLSHQDDAPVPLAVTPLVLRMSAAFRNFQELRRGHMESAYAVWIGQPVILQIAAEDVRVPLRGMILGETDDFIRFRVEQAWDIDIYKSMILAVEQDRWTRVLVN
jgi:hypothetical protein